MKRIQQLAVLALALVITGGTLSESEAQRRGRRNTQTTELDQNVDGISDSKTLRHRRGGDKLGLGSLRGQLSATQRTELKDQIGTLRESGASAEEIGTAIATQLATNGVELPSGFAERLVERETKHTERQAKREEVKALVEGLKADGATREEIRQALQDAGYEKPQRGRRNGHRGGSKPNPAPVPETSSVE